MLLNKLGNFTYGHILLNSMDIYGVTCFLYSFFYFYKK